MEAELTPAQLKVAQLLVHGYKATDICRAMQIKPNTLAVHLSAIRTKTKLKGTTLRALGRKLCTCKLIHDRDLYTERKHISEMQLKVLQMIASKKTYAQVCEELRITVGTAMNHAWEGRKRLGVVAKGRPGMKELRFLLQKFSNDPMNDPMFQ